MAYIHISPTLNHVSGTIQVLNPLYGDGHPLVFRVNNINEVGGPRPSIIIKMHEYAPGHGIADGVTGITGAEPNTYHGSIGTNSGNGWSCVTVRESPNVWHFTISRDAGALPIGHRIYFRLGGTSFIPPAGMSEDGYWEVEEDTDPPVLENTIPGDEETDVDENSTIALSINDAKIGTDIDEINIQVKNGLRSEYEDAVVNGVIVAPWDGDDSDIVANLNGGYDIVLDHVEGLAVDDTIEVSVNAADLLGNVMSEEQYRFSTFTSFRVLLDPMTVGKDGGGPFDITVLGIPAGDYYVRSGTVLDHELGNPAYNGNPGSGGLVITFTAVGDEEGSVRATGVYLKPLEEGVNHLSFKEAIEDGETYYATSDITALPVTFRNRTLTMRRILPDSYELGIRNPDQER